jgi:hypothetical protein
MINGDFEATVTHRGFDWRYSTKKDQGWGVERVSDVAQAGAHSLRVTFTGEKNLSFAHLYQIVPVTPKAAYVLTAWWKGDGITTDQGPFLEVYGYDGKGLHVTGPKQVGTWDWEAISLHFSVPEGCHAVVVRLRRLPSRKLDNQIKGTVWVDDFQLSEVRSQESGDGGQESGVGGR